jgi:hypothetical protein
MKSSEYANAAPAHVVALYLSVRERKSERESERGARSGREHAA